MFIPNYCIIISINPTYKMLIITKQIILRLVEDGNAKLLFHRKLQNLQKHASKEVDYSNVVSQYGTYTHMKKFKTLI